MPITPFILDQLYTPIIRLCVTPDEPIELLIQRAKVALYRAKTLGRNGVEYEPAQPLLPFDSLPFVPSAEQSEI